MKTEGKQQQEMANAASREIRDRTMEKGGGIVALVIVTALCLAVIVIAVWAQTTAPPTAREAAKMPEYASRLSHPQAGHKSLPPLLQSGQPELIFVTPANGDVLSGTDLLIYVADTVPGGVPGRLILYQWSTDGTVWNTIPPQDSPDFGPGSYTTAVDTTTLPSGPLYLRASAYPPIYVQESPATIQVSVQQQQSLVDGLQRWVGEHFRRVFGLGPAQGYGTIYNNGPTNGNTDAWNIGFGYVVSDSFTVLNSGSTVTAMTFAAWLLPGDTLGSATIGITSAENGGTVYFNATESISQSGCVANYLGFVVCNETANFAGPTLNSGSYWVNLQNGQATNGDSVYWDENSGPSSASMTSVGTIPSESFTVLGETTTTCQVANMTVNATGPAPNMDPRPHWAGWNGLLGLDNQYISADFTVVTNLVAGSNANYCREGQKAASTSTWDDRPKDTKWACVGSQPPLNYCRIVPGKPDPCAASGGVCTPFPYPGNAGPPNLGEDDYTRVKRTAHDVWTKSHSPTQVVWFDSPGFAMTPQALALNTPGNYIFQGLATVWNSDGGIGAQCDFWIQIQWANGVYQNPSAFVGLIPTNSTGNCTLNKGP